MLRIIAPPAVPVVSPQEAAEHLAITPEELPHHTGNLTRMIAAVTAWLAGPSGWLERSLVEQTLELTTTPTLNWGSVSPRWDGEDFVILPRPPLIAVDAVSWIDAAGNDVDWAPSDFAVKTGRDGLPRLIFAPGMWPFAGEETLRVRYRAGYGPTGQDVDAGIRQGVLMTVARLHANRGDGLTSLDSDSFARTLFASYRVWTPSP